MSDAAEQYYDFHSDDTGVWVLSLVLIAFGAIRLLLLVPPRAPVWDTLLDSPGQALFDAAFVLAGAARVAFHRHRSIEIDGEARVLRVRCRNLWRREDEDIPFARVLSVVHERPYVGSKDMTLRGNTLRFELKDGRNIPTDSVSQAREETADLSRALASLIGCDRSER